MCHMARMLLVRMLCSSRAAILSKERHEPLPEHVERCQESREQTNSPENPTSIRTGQGVVKNCVLTEEACERPKTRNRERSGRHGQECPRNFLSKPTHLEHVLFATDSVDH